MPERLFDLDTQPAACRHLRTVLVPRFPGDAWVCADCGADGCKAGYTEGIRDYYLPGDPPWRRQSQLRKLEWLTADVDEDLEQCPECCFVGTIDDFDVLGADDGHLFCNQCGVEFEQ